jgi:hypothetical protein
MKSFAKAALAALTVCALAPALPQESKPETEGGTTTGEGRTRVIIGAGLGGVSGAKYKVNGQTISFKDRFQGSTDATSTVAVKVATFGIALKPGLYAGLDLTGVAKAGNVPVTPTSNEKTYLQITDYFAALTWFPWESGLFLKAGTGISTFALAIENGNNTHASGLGFLVGAGYALQLTGNHHLTLTVEQTWQSYGGSSSTKPDSSQFASFFLGYLYKN